jgi:tetratricopeptide (TPR) repeat protein
VRLLVDVGNWFSARGKLEEALASYRLALRVGPDTASRQIVLINRGVAQLRGYDPDGAYVTLTEALMGCDGRMGATHWAACYYNLGLACRRTGREAEAIRRFNEAVDAWPDSVFGRAAARALEKNDKDSPADSE